MGTTIITKNGSGAPAADDLVAGELAVDLTNKRLYTKDSGNNILELGSSPSTIVFSSVASNITPSADDTYDLGATGTKWRDIYIDGTAYLDAINFNGTAITATAAELNILDGVTSTAAELNILDGVTSTAAELNILDGVTATTAELNILDGVTSTTAELNILDGVTSTTAELNILDGVTATATELNYVDGVTSAIQTQLDAKAPTASPTLTGTVTAADLIISNRQIATADASGTNTAGNSVTLKAGASTGSAAGGSLIFQTTPAGSTGTSVNSFSTVMTLDESGIDVAGAVEFDSLSGTGSVSVTDILDQDDMSSDSATALATQQSIKAYVDSQIGSNNELSEVLAIGNTTGSTNIVVTAGQSITTDTIAETTAAAGVTVDSLLIKDGGITAAGTSTFAGQTISDLGTVTTANIDGGSIDGTTIGASTAAAITGTTGQFNTSLNVDGTVTADGLTVDGDVTVTGASAINLSSEQHITYQTTSTNATAGDHIFKSYNTEIMRIDGNNNRVGIGTASPSSVLHLSTSNDPKITLTDTGFGASADITGSNGNLRLNSQTATLFDIADSEVMRIDSSGNVGIGGSPDTKLHLIDGGTPEFRLESTDSSVVSGQSLGDITWESNDVSGGGQGVRAKIHAEAENAGTIYGLVFSTGAGAAPTEKVRITNTGAVGIGTASPVRGLQVQTASSNFGNTFLVDSTSGTTGTGGGVIFGSDDGLGTDVSVAAIQGIKENSTAGNQQGALLLTTKNNVGVNTERMRIDSSGNVGIGETSPQTPLHISSDSASGENIALQIDNNDQTAGNQITMLFRSRVGATNTDFSIAGVANGANDMDLAFRSDGGTERMRIDSSGNLLVGTTTTTAGNAGLVYFNGSSLRVTRSANEPLNLDRLGSSGTEYGSLIDLKSNGTTVGSIGATGGDLFIGTGDAGLWFQDGGNAIRPFRVDTQVGLDNSISLGVATTGRFDDAFIVNGVTTGSDANDKQDIETLSDAEQRVAVACKGLLRKWRWKDAVEAKGDEARIHFGIIAQDLQAAFEAEGLDAGRYAMFMSNTWTDEETGEERTRLGVRYHELLAFIIAAI